MKEKEIEVRTDSGKMIVDIEGTRIRYKDIDDVEIIDNLRVFVKKPVEVYAVQMLTDFVVDTLEGTMHGNKWDYLICGVEGEFYPCKPDIFKKTYQTID